MSEAEAGTAPIPAPGDGAECVGGAAPGPQSREAPAQGRRGEDNTAAIGGGGSMVLSKAIEWLLVIVFGLLMVGLAAPILLGW